MPCVPAGGEAQAKAQADAIKAEAAANAKAPAAAASKAASSHDEERKPQIDSGQVYGATAWSDSDVGRVVGVRDFMKKVP